MLKLLIRCLPALVLTTALSPTPLAFGASAPRGEAARARILLGVDAVEAQQGVLLAGRPEAFRLRAHASGLATQVRLYIDEGTTATTVVVGLYRNTDDRPSSLLSTGSISSPRTGAWNAASLTPSRLVSGRLYWLTVLGEDGTLRYRDRSRGRCPSDASALASLSALPASWSIGRIHRHAHCPISAYALATAASAPPSATPPVRLGPLFTPAPLGPVSPLKPASRKEPASPVEPTPTEKPAQPEEPTEKPPPHEEPTEKPPPHEEPTEEPPPHEEPTEEPPPGGTPYPECTQTLSKGANVPSAVSGAAAGTVVCLNSGAYGELTLNSTHTADVTLQAAPKAHVTMGTMRISGSHLVVRGFWVDGEISLEAGTTFVTVDRNDITNLHESGGEGVVFNTSDCKAPNAPEWPECEPLEPITDVTISGNRFHGIGQKHSEDAIHLDYWKRVTVIGNEFEHVIESGNHTDCLQSVYGGEDLTFTRNYEHDNDCQGIFVKDGDATNVSFTNNLLLRDDEPDEAGERFYNLAQFWNIKNLTVQNNTIWDGKGFVIVAEGASFTPSATIDHNLISNFSVSKPIGSPYTLTENNDIFGESPNNFSLGSGDTIDGSPQFVDTATDDYRLASNPKGIGIDWSPAEEHYGPAS